MRIFSVGNYCNAKVNFGKISNHATSFRTEISSVNTNVARGLDALSFMGVNGQYGVKKYVPQEVQSAIDEFRERSEAVNILIRDKQKQINETEKNIKKQVDKATKDGEKTYNEVMALFKKGDETLPDGTVLRRIKQKDNTKVMEEFDKYGEIKRISILNGENLEIQEGIEELDDGANKIARVLIFHKGKPYLFIKNQENFIDGSLKTGKRIMFTDKKTYCYDEGREIFANKKEKIAKTIFFHDGKISLCEIGYEKFAHDSWKTAEEISVSHNGKLSYYAKNYTKSADELNTEQEITFMDEELRSYSENVKEFNNSIAKSLSVRLRFLHQKPRTFMKGYSLSDDGTRKIDEKLTYSKEASFYTKNFTSYADGTTEKEKYYRLDKHGWQKIEE